MMTVRSAIWFWRWPINPPGDLRLRIRLPQQAKMISRLCRRAGRCKCLKRNYVSALLFSSGSPVGTTALHRNAVAHGVSHAAFVGSRRAGVLGRGPFLPPERGCRGHVGNPASVGKRIAAWFPQTMRRSCPFFSVLY